MRPTIWTSGLVTCYGQATALAGFDLEVPEGTASACSTPMTGRRRSRAPTCAPKLLWVVLLLAVFVPLAVRQYARTASR